MSLHSDLIIRHLDLGSTFGGSAADPGGPRRTRLRQHQHGGNFEFGIYRPQTDRTSRIYVTHVLTYAEEHKHV